MGVRTFVYARVYGCLCLCVSECVCVCECLCVCKCVFVYGCSMYGGIHGLGEGVILHPDGRPVPFTVWLYHSTRQDWYTNFDLFPHIKYQIQ